MKIGPRSKADGCWPTSGSVHNGPNVNWNFNSFSHASSDFPHSISHHIFFSGVEDRSRALPLHLDLKGQTASLKPEV